MVNLTTASLCTINDVKRLVGFNALDDVSDAELGSFIKDATDEVYADYGNPIVVTYAMIEWGTGSTLYDFTGDYSPVYSIKRISIGGDFNQITPTGSYTEYLDTGFVDIGSDYLSTYDGKTLKFEFVPNLYHQLAANIAAMDILTTMTTISSDDSEVAKISRINGKLTKLREEIKPKGVFNATTLAGQDTISQGYNYIQQKHWYDLY